MTVEAKITKETNDPATFIATVASITSIGENRISLLMKGVLKERRLHYAEMLLEDLINQGLSGQDLLQQFKLQLRNRPIKSTSKK
jgi:DNA polymerase III delta prime subunit